MNMMFSSRLSRRYFMEVSMKSRLFSSGVFMAMAEIPGGAADREVAVFPQLGHTSWACSAVYSPNGRRIVSASLNGTVKVWDAETGAELRSFSGHTDRVHSVIYSPDGKCIVSASQDGTVKVWAADRGTMIAQFISFDDGEWVCITPDGYYAASQKGDAHINVRVDGEVSGIDRYRHIYHRPELVADRLSGRDG
jgi:WD40 repeat protein